jgi:hypothetical protein
MTQLRRTSAWLFLTFAFFNIGITRGHFAETDELNIYQTTRSLYERGDFAVGHTRNTYAGREDLPYSVYNSGLAFIALPMYVIGKQARSALTAIGREDWVRTISGPPLGQEP